LRIVLFAGRGGVGTTTAAAATAALASRSAKVLLVSAGAFGVPPGPRPVAVGDLRVLHPDLRAGFEARWPLGLVAAGELALPPGAAELLTLLDVRDAAGNWDAVLVDGLSVDSLLSLRALAGTVERLWPEHQRIVHRSELTDTVSALQSALSSVEELLAGASVRLVIAPSASTAVRETLTALALHGYAVDSVIANRMLPTAGPWATQVRAAQEEALAGLELDVPVRRAPYLAAEPVTPDALLALGESVYGTADPLAPCVAPAPSVTRTGDEFELRLALPYVRRGSVTLARSGDDLLVTVGDQLRRLPLPSVLRRCVAVGASAGDGAVRIRFRPDPALWPREVPR
jgi:arsenite-transporting ATPase